MKTLLSICFLLCISAFNAQIKKIGLVDFYHWTANDGLYYEFIISSEASTEYEKPAPAEIRVRYSTDGGVSYKIAEYNAELTWQKDTSDAENIIAYIDAEQKATIIQGDSSYTPDNFIFYFTKAGKFLRAYQADHNELAKTNIEYAKVFPTEHVSTEKMRSLVRLFYVSSDPFYRELMTYIANFD